MVPGPFFGMKIDGMCFHPLRPDKLGLCVTAAVWEGDLPGVVVQLLRDVRSRFAIPLRIGGANHAEYHSVA